MCSLSSVPFVTTDRTAFLYLSTLLTSLGHFSLLCSAPVFPVEYLGFGGLAARVGFGGVVQFFQERE